MKKIPIVLAFLILCLPPSLSAGERGGFRKENKDRIKAYWQQQKRENKEFRQSLRQSGKDEGQKTAAIKEHRQTQYGENVAFRDQLYEERTAYILENEKFNEDQKQAILHHIETQYNENADFRAHRHQEYLNLLDALAARPDLSQEQRKAEMRNHRQAQKQRNQQHHQTQREENRVFWQSMRK